MYLTLCLVQKICPTPESLKQAKHLQEVCATGHPYEEKLPEVQKC